MSVKIMAALWERELSMRDGWILMALADHADHTGGSIRPGVPLIAWKVGLSERQVMRVFKELEQRGILIRVRERAGKPVEYRMDLSGVPMKPEYRKRATPDIAVSPDIAMSPLTSHEKMRDTTPDMPSAKTARIHHKEEPSEILSDADASGATTDTDTPSKPKHKRTTTPKNPTPHSAAPPSPRKPDEVFDAVRECVFGLAQPNGSAPRIGMAAKAIRSIQPDASAADVRAFVDWYKSQYPNVSVPRDDGKISEHYAMFRQQRTAAPVRQAPAMETQQYFGTPSYQITAEQAAQIRAEFAEMRRRITEGVP